MKSQTHRTLYVFERARDMRDFTIRANRGRYMATTHLNLVESLRGNRFGDVVIDPDVRLAPKERGEINCRLSLGGYLVEPGEREFAELVADATRTS